MSRKKVIFGAEPQRNSGRGGRGGGHTANQGPFILSIGDSPDIRPFLQPASGQMRDMTAGYQLSEKGGYPARCWIMDMTAGYRLSEKGGYPARCWI